MINPQSTKTPKPFSWKTAFLLSLCVGLLALGFSLFFQTHTIVVASAPQSPAPVVAAPQVKGSGASFEVPGTPTQLIIPAIGVDANVQSVGMWWRVPTEIGIPTNFTDVAWYNGSPLPGEPGSSVIDGHYDGHDVKEAVFYNLGNLKPGDMVEVVDSGGKTLQFTVTATKLFDYNATTTDIFTSNDGKAHLNLITCAGDWISSQGIYNQRVVVFTDLVTS